MASCRPTSSSGSAPRRTGRTIAPRSPDSTSAAPRPIRAAPLAAAAENLDRGLSGVPTDLGGTNRPGARHGPREIRNSSSLMRGFNLGLGVNPYELCRIADLGDVRLSHRYDLEKQVEEI